jgi:hypothetical protein
MPVQTAIQHRRGAAATWTSTNPTLAAGEIGFESDTGKFKIGTGSDAWAALPYSALPISIIDAKGDLIAGTGADAAARLPVGSNGDTLVADSAATTGLRWEGNYAAGKNKIINGDFRISQRGTSFSNPISNTYTLDRWFYTPITANPIAMTISQQTFTTGAAPVAGYEGANFLRMSLTTIGVGQTRSDITTRLEDCRLFAGQTVTLSFWAKSDSNRTNTMRIQRNFGSGGSSAETIVNPVSFSTTTDWTRFTFTRSISSISGKTIGTSSFIELFIGQAVASGCVFDIWGVQLEAGSVATAFQTSTGTLQGELAACQRYYYRTNPGSGTILGIGNSYSTTGSVIYISYPVPMRIRPTALEQTGTAANYKTLRSSGAAFDSCTAVPAYDGGTSSSMASVATVSDNLTQGQVAQLFSDAAGAFLGWSVEL